MSDHLESIEIQKIHGGQGFKFLSARQRDRAAPSVAATTFAGHHLHYLTFKIYSESLFTQASYSDCVVR